MPDASVAGAEQKLSDLAGQIEQKTTEGVAAARPEFEKLEKDVDEAPKKISEGLKSIYPEGVPAPPKPPKITPFQPPPQRDAFASFGNIATVLGALGGLLTRHPLTASLNASAEAMKALHENDIENYKRAWEEHKQQQEYAFKQSDYELQGYKTFLENKQMMTEEILGGIRMHASLVQNKAMLTATETQGLEGAAGLYGTLINANLKAKELAIRVGEEMDKRAEQKLKLEAQTEFQTAITVRQNALKTGDPKVIKEAQETYDAALEKLQAIVVPQMLAKPLTMAQMQSTAVQMRLQAQNYPAGSPERAQLEAQASSLEKSMATSKSESEGVALDDETSTILAQALYAGDDQPMKSVLGFSKNRPQIVTQVLKKLKALHPEVTGEQLAGFQAAFGGEKAAAAVVGRTTGSVAVAVEELKRIAPVVKETSRLVDRTEYPNVNAIDLAIQKGTGDTNIIKLNSYIQTMRNAYAQVMARGGRMTDTQREYAKELIDGTLSVDQLGAATDAITVEAGIAQESAKAALKDVTGQPSDTTAPPAGDTTGTSKSGKPIVYRNGHWEYQ